jgi:DNA ligase-1
MKPMLASDYDESKLRFPLIAQPKIDGVRGLNMLGTLTGRSLKKHANRHTTGFFSHSSLIGFDGELAAECETHPDLCRMTTSALNTIEGVPFLLWWLFDYVTPATRLLTYENRMAALFARVRELHHDRSLFALARHLSIVPSVTCNTLEELLDCDAKWLDAGFEGTIVRDPNGMHKQGRSTAKEGGLLRIKRFIEEEAVVVAVEEGQTNLNEAQRNELGYVERSTHQANMVPNGMVGTLRCRVVKDVESGGKLVLQAGQEITVAAGCMPHEDRDRFLKKPELILGHTIKFQFFPKGIKDKPRFPTFQSIRAASDMGGE